MVEAILLLCFGLVGGRVVVVDGLFVSLTVMLLAFIMGLQNAVITKISHSEIRTTHVTGLITDLGIELGKLLYVNGLHEGTPVMANRKKLQLHIKLITSFFIGGLLGAVGFKFVGFITTVPLAVLLLMLVWHPVVKDARHWANRLHPKRD